MRVVVVVVVLVIAVASGTVAAQGGNPIAAVLDQLNGKLDSILAVLQPAGGPTRLTTAAAKGGGPSNLLVGCVLSNVSDEPVANVTLRLINVFGTPILTTTTPSLNAGATTFFGSLVEGYHRCQFDFDGTPAMVRATLALETQDEVATVTLEAR
jgi:hypothetical protein